MLLVLAAMALIDFFDPVDTSLAQAVQLIHSILILAPVPVQQYPLWGERTQTQTHSNFTRHIKIKVLSGKPEYPNSKFKISY